MGTWESVASSVVSEESKAQPQPLTYLPAFPSTPLLSLGQPFLVPAAFLGNPPGKASTAALTESSITPEASL